MASKKRLDDFLFNSVHDISHAFTKASLICVGCDVLGQILYGVKIKDNGDKDVFSSEKKNTAQIFEILDNRLHDEITSNTIFYTNFEKATHKNTENIPPTLKPNSSKGYEPHFSHLLYHGLRNQYIHSYRPYGVLLSDNHHNFDKTDDFIKIKENEGLILVQPSNFWGKFQVFYEEHFKELILGTSKHTSKAVEYLGYIA